ncbi:TonB-dependent receptor domain-containing protein [Dongshaea marina]|uniref:TonB-dependent receptor domain-containing protein n=1 Tax=Dongshaea marina TaxID=2047966 RepID=UPI000D3ECC3A|nr:TonB-dependent receptor [Dongshaea marina]
MDWYQDKTDGTREGASRPVPADGDTQVWGSYLQANIPLAQSWSLNPGVRYDSFSTQASNVANSKRSNDHLSPSVGLSWQTTDWLRLTARYDEAFRAPTTEELYTTGTHYCMGPGMCNTFVPNPDLKPETAQNKELSADMKFRDLLGDDSLKFKGSLFQNDVKDFIETVYTATTTTYQNTTNARLQGYELAAHYRWREITTALSYGQTRGTNRDNGQALSDIPADTWVWEIGHSFMQRDLNIGAQFTHAGSQDRVPSSSSVEGYSGYTITNLYMRWQPAMGTFSGVTVDVGVDNLTNRDYRQAFANLDSPGRNIKLNVRYQF